MTATAISSWEERAGSNFGPDCIGVADIPTETARRAMILVDYNRAVFDRALRKP